jgi:hypothetical protein
MLAPFLCLALLPFGRPDSTNRSSHFNLVFDTPNSFAVSSAVANFESSTTVIGELSIQYTPKYPIKPGSWFIFRISPIANLYRHWPPQRVPHVSVLHVGVLTFPATRLLPPKSFCP